MPIVAPKLPIEIPVTDVWDLIFETPSLNFDVHLPIYIDAATREQYTWTQVKSAALTFGEILQSQWQWEKGDVLALFSPNSIDFPIAVFGTLAVGGIVSPANPSYTVNELVFQLKDFKAKAVVTSSDGLQIVKEAAKIVGIPLSRIVLIGPSDGSVEGVSHWSSLRRAGGVPSIQRPAINAKEDLVFIAYSSGTTGLPKGVMLSHYNITTALLQDEATDVGNVQHGDRILAVVPYYHIFGMATLVSAPVHRGQTTIVMKKYSLEAFLTAVQAFRITHASLVPPIILQIVKSALTDQHDITSLRMILCAAAPLTRDLIEELYRKHKIPIRQAYGTTETSPGVAIQNWQDCRDNVGSVGRLMPNMEATICDERGVEIATGESGEIYLRGPNVFRGYLNNPQATAASIDESGWFRTGDVGHFDENSNLFITDRIKELIKYKGTQVAPAELEGVLLGHPDVADVAVLGIYSDLHASEVPRAYVVLKPQVKPGADKAEEIALWLQNRVASFKWLRGGVEFMSAIPKNPSGKILRRVIKSASSGAMPLKAKI